MGVICKCRNAEIGSIVFDNKNYRQVNKMLFANFIEIIFDKIAIIFNSIGDRSALPQEFPRVKILANVLKRSKLRVKKIVIYFDKSFLRS